jgi:type IV secretory pathway TraG/TraD family ATPase VirD4
MTSFSVDPAAAQVAALHAACTAGSAAAGHALYLGHGGDQWHFARPEHSMLVLGPPRSGKTSSVVIPNLFAAAGPVVSTSTKPDVVAATSAVRGRIGRCLLFDPTGSFPSGGTVEPLRWSPLQTAATWDGAVAVAASLVDVGAAPASGRPDSGHWNERARSLLAPLLHAGSLEELDMRTVLGWVDRRQANPAKSILAAAPAGTADLAYNSLDGITATDERELSGIWSTASGALSGYRSERALATTVAPDMDAAAFVDSADTIYICAPAHRQALVAPMVVGLLEDVRNAAYARSASLTGRPGTRPPVLLALDEVANIAPLPSLPALVSEGGGQGLVTLACFQDLSQARRRWPQEAEGFPSLFGTTMVLPGIADVRTLEALSTLAGDEEVATRSVSAGRAPTGHPFTDAVTGGRPTTGESMATRLRRRLPPDLIGQGAPGHALVFDERNQAGWIPLAPAHGVDPWRPMHEFGHREHVRLRDRAVDLGR